MSKTQNTSLHLVILGVFQAPPLCPLVAGIKTGTNWWDIKSFCFKQTHPFQDPPTGHQLRPVRVQQPSTNSLLEGASLDPLVHFYPPQTEETSPLRLIPSAQRPFPWWTPLFAVHRSNAPEQVQGFPERSRRVPVPQSQEAVRMVHFMGEFCHESRCPKMCAGAVGRFLRPVRGR